MEIEELAETYAQQSVDDIAVTELYSAMDCSDIRSNAYEMNIDNGDGTVTSHVLRFEKFVTDWAPFVQSNVDDGTCLTAEGELPRYRRPQEIGPDIAQHVYEEFNDAAAYGTYHGDKLSGLRESCETFREYTSSEPEVIVVDAGMLDNKQIRGLEEMEDVDIHESTYIDLGEQVLVSNKRLGYYATRTPIEARSYIDSAELYDEDIPPTVDEPFVIQTGTRIDVVNIFEDCAMAFEPIS